MTETKLSGKSEMKGRNGYFKLDSVWTGNWPDLSPDQPIQVDFYSKRAGDSPPSRLKLTREDAEALRDALNRVLEIGEALEHQTRRTA